MPTSTCANGTAPRTTAAASALALLLLGVQPAAAQWTSRYEDLGYLTTKAYVLAATCGYVIDDAAYLDWMRANVPPEARPAFGVGSKRAGDEIMQITSRDVLELWDDIDAGRPQRLPRGAPELLKACPNLRAAAESLGLLAAP